MKYIIIFSSILFMGCLNENKEKEQEILVRENVISLSKEQLQNTEIKIGKTEQIQLSQTIKVKGKIEVPPQNLVSITVPLGGYLKSSKLLPGMTFQKGEIIAVLENNQYIELQQEYLITKAKVETAEADFNRQKELNINNATSDKVYQQAKEYFMSQKIMLSALSEKLKLINVNPSNLSIENLSKSINIYAPFNGFVSKVLVNTGRYVSQTDVLFELVNPDDIHLVLNVFEKDISGISIGQKVYAYTNSKPSTKFRAKIILISKDIMSDGTAEVHCHFEKYESSLMPGIYINADIELDTTESIGVQETSIVNYESKNYVFVQLDNNTFEMVEVQLGIKEGAWFQILNFNELENKNIVTQGAYTLLMALKNKSEE